MEYLTQAIYRASKPDEMQPLYDLVNGSAERWSAAIALREKGYKINVPIDIWGWEAPKAMAYFAQLGASFVPALYEVAPGTIPVSVDAADYPPAHLAPAPVPEPSNSPIGPQSTTPGVYKATPAAFHNSRPLYPEGAQLNAPNGEAVYFHLFLQAFFGTTEGQWETSAARAKRQAEEGTAINNFGMPTGGAVEVRP